MFEYSLDFLYFKNNGYHYVSIIGKEKNPRIWEIYKEIQPLEI